MINSFSLDYEHQFITQLMKNTAFDCYNQQQLITDASTSCIDNPHIYDI